MDRPVYCYVTVCAGYDKDRLLLIRTRRFLAESEEQAIEMGIKRFEEEVGTQSISYSANPLNEALGDLFADGTVQWYPSEKQ